MSRYFEFNTNRILHKFLFLNEFIKRVDEK